MEKNQLKRTSVLSVLSLFFQSGYTSLLGLTANLVLTVLLSPAIFGIYITVLSLISLLNYFSDIGLAASLIQKKELRTEDITTTFTVQQLLILTLIGIGYLATGFIQSFYALPPQGVQLYWALLLAFFLSSLKTIPSVFLERKIQFHKIVLVQIIENTVFYISLIILALMGHGLQSFTISVLLRAIVGTIAIYSISFWMPQIGISSTSLRELLSFGLPFQTSSFLALFKDDLLILYLGKVLGFEGVGYIGWAKKWAEAPIRVIMDNISRVLFPILARIQQDKGLIQRLIERLLMYQTILLAPVLAGLALVMKDFVEIIPNYSKWQPALPLFYIFCLSAFFSSYSTPFINLFNALGKVKFSFMFMLVWTIATWTLTPLLTHHYGLYGFPLTQLTLAISAIFVVYTAKKIVPFAFIKTVYKPLLSTIALMGIVLLLETMIPPSVARLIGIIIVGIITYNFFLYVIFKINLITELKSLFNHA